jgi:putative ABC transport system permease protein
VSLEAGPIIRSLIRRKATFWLVLLEVASGFTTITALVLAGTWYEQFITPAADIDRLDGDLVKVAIQVSLSNPDSRSAAADADARAARDLARMRAVPGVLAAAPVASSVLDERLDYPVEVSATAGPPARTAVGWSVVAGPEIAAVLGLRVREGAFPDPAAGRGREDEVALTRCLRAGLFAAGTAAVGQLVQSADALPARVVAVVDDVILGDPWNMVRSCVAIRFGRPWDERDARYLVRARPGGQRDLVPALQAALGGSTADRHIDVAAFDPADAHRVKMARGLVITLAVFGAIVAIIALLGTFTVSSFLVRERRRTIGIRRALGATPWDVVRYFLVENSIVVLAGLGLGLFFSWALFTFMRGFYPGLAIGWRPLLFTGLLLWLDATVAAWLPARHATRSPTPTIDLPAPGRP